MLDIFDVADFIRLDWDQGFVIRISSLYAHVKIPCGEALTAARLMKANGVRHFDYTDAVINSEAFEEFAHAAKLIGFDI